MEAIPRLRLARCKRGDSGTFGVLNYEALKKHWFTGELPFRGNLTSISCIPPGVYRCDWLWSPSHNRNVYHLLEVPSRTDVEIHAGNFCGDTSKGLKSDVLGCIILGQGQGEIEGQWAVRNSKEAVQDFETTLGGQSFMLSIEDAYMDTVS